MPRLSIVIPCVQDAARFETTLASVLQNRPDDCEVLVVQPRAYTDPYELKDEVRFVQGPEGSSLVDLINLGIQMAHGAILHVLSCEMEALEGWAEPAMAHFRETAIASVSPLVVDRGTQSQVVARGVDYGSGGVRRVRRGGHVDALGRRHQVLGPTLAAGFYRRQSLLEIGSFRSEVGVELADVDISLRLQAVGYRCVHEERSLVATEGTVDGPLLTYQSGREAEQFFWCQTAQSGWLSVLCLHPCGVMAELFCNLLHPQILLRMLGRVKVCLERITPGHAENCVGLQQPVGQMNAQRVLPLKPATSTERDATVNPRAAA